MKYVVSIKPADDPGGPLFATDDPAVVRAVLDAVQDRFRPPEDRPPLRLHKRCQRRLAETEEEPCVS